jgi:hypothetical protein
MLALGRVDPEAFATRVSTDFLRRNAIAGAVHAGNFEGFQKILHHGGVGVDVLNEMDDWNRYGLENTSVFFTGPSTLGLLPRVQANAPRGELVDVEQEDVARRVAVSIAVMQSACHRCCSVFAACRSLFHYAVLSWNPAFIRLLLSLHLPSFTEEWKRYECVRIGMR